MQMCLLDNKITTPSTHPSQEYQRRSSLTVKCCQSMRDPGVLIVAISLFSVLHILIPPPTCAIIEKRVVASSGIYLSARLPSFVRVVTVETIITPKLIISGAKDEPVIQSPLSFFFDRLMHSKIPNAVPIEAITPKTMAILSPIVS